MTAERILTRLRLESRVYAVRMTDKPLTACRRRALARRGKPGLRTNAAFITVAVSSAHDGIPHFPFAYSEYFVVKECVFAPLR